MAGADKSLYEIALNMGLSYDEDIGLTSDQVEYVMESIAVWESMHLTSAWCSPSLGNPSDEQHHQAEVSSE